MSRDSASPQTPSLVLASSSPYRRELLSRLRLPFQSASPDIDETPQPGEPPESLAYRLAREKARALAREFSSHLIIGSDQVAASPDGNILGKPLTADKARQQLLACQGKTVTFYTGLSLYHSGEDLEETLVESFLVRFRPLSEQAVKDYLETEKPFDCAGSFRMEGLGIALFEELRGRDPNALIGLPLIALVDGLARFGVNVLQAARSANHTG